MIWLPPISFSNEIHLYHRHECTALRSCILFFPFYGSFSIVALFHLSFLMLAGLIQLSASWGADEFFTLSPAHPNVSTYLPKLYNSWHTPINILSTAHADRHEWIQPLNTLQTQIINPQPGICCCTWKIHVTNFHNLFPLFLKSQIHQ